MKIYRNVMKHHTLEVIARAEAEAFGPKPGSAAAGAILPTARAFYLERALGIESDAPAPPISADDVAEAVRAKVEAAHRRNRGLVDRLYRKAKERGIEF